VLCKCIDRIFVCRLKINYAWSISSCVKFLRNVLVVAKQYPTFVSSMISNLGSCSLTPRSIMQREVRSYRSWSSRKSNSELWNQVKKNFKRLPRPWQEQSCKKLQMWILQYPLPLNTIEEHPPSQPTIFCAPQI
jgi:hypothetical protein